MPVIGDAHRACYHVMFIDRSTLGLVAAGPLHHGGEPVRLTAEPATSPAASSHMAHANGYVVVEVAGGPPAQHGTPHIRFVASAVEQ